MHVPPLTCFLKTGANYIIYFSIYVTYTLKYGLKECLIGGNRYPNDYI